MKNIESNRGLNTNGNRRNSFGRVQQAGYAVTLLCASLLQNGCCPKQTESAGKTDRNELWRSWEESQQKEKEEREKMEDAEEMKEIARTLSEHFGEILLHFPDVKELKERVTRIEEVKEWIERLMRIEKVEPKELTLADIARCKDAFISNKGKMIEAVLARQKALARHERLGREDLRSELYREISKVIADTMRHAPIEKNK